MIHDVLGQLGQDFRGWSKMFNHPHRTGEDITEEATLAKLAEQPMDIPIMFSNGPMSDLAFWREQYEDMITRWKWRLHCDSTKYKPNQSCQTLHIFTLAVIPVLRTRPMTLEPEEVLPAQI